MKSDKDCLKTGLQLTGEVYAINFQKNHSNLVVTGTEDVAVPANDSLIIAQKIPEAWLIQIKDAGHGVMYQYPEKLNFKHFLQQRQYHPIESTSIR